MYLYMARRVHMLLEAERLYLRKYTLDDVEKKGYQMKSMRICRLREKM